MLSGYNQSIIDESRVSWASCVIGYLVDYRTISVGLINKLVRDHWTTRGRISAHKMGDLYMFKCSNILDKNDIIDRSIAFFDGALMVFKEWLPNISPHTMRFTHARIWVRVYGLPFEFLNSHIASLIGSMFGNEFRMGDSPNFPSDDYLRIRVLIELEKPLLPGFYLALQNGSLVWVQFKYEGLCKACIRCGCLGHKVSNCCDTDARIKENIDTLLSEVTHRGFPTLPAQNNFTKFKLDFRVTSSNSASRVYRVRLRQDKKPQHPSVYSRIYPGSTFMQGMQPFMGPLLQPKEREGSEFGSVFNKINQMDQEQEEEAILDRIESDVEWERVEEDNWDYNQTLDTPPLVSDEVNTELNLNLGGVSIKSGGASLQKDDTLVDCSSLSVTPAAFIRKVLEIQAGSSSLKHLDEGGFTGKDKGEREIDDTDQGGEERLGGVGLEEQPSRFFAAPAAGISANLIDTMDEEHKEAVSAPRKRKCCTEIEEGLVPEDAVATLGKAKRSLQQWAKKRCTGSGVVHGGLKGEGKACGSFRVRVAVMDVDMEESTDSSAAGNDEGFAEVGPVQPPHSP